MKVTVPAVVAGRPTQATRLLALLFTLAACSDIPTTPQATPLERFERKLARVTSGEQGSLLAGRVLLRYKDGADPNALATAYSAELGEPLLLARLVVLEVPEGQEEQIAAQLRTDPNVEFAEADYMISHNPCANGGCEINIDRYLGYRWDLFNTGHIINENFEKLFQTDKVDADVDALEMAIATGNFTGSAKVGIVDTGIRDTHEDLAGRVAAAMNHAVGYPTNFTLDRIGHGTHVAGIAAAAGNNGIGGSGIAFGRNIKLISSKACELYLFPGNIVASACPASSVANAIVWAVDQGANVINISLGGSPAATAGFLPQQLALQYALSKNVLPFCAAGNDNFPNVAFPARFPECVAVSATNWGDARASYSNFGDKVELSAPGGDGGPGWPYSGILSTFINGESNTTYAWAAGTSMATPQAVGLAAVLYALGMTDANAVRQRLQKSANDLGTAGRDVDYGFGRINAYRAVCGDGWFSKKNQLKPVSHRVFCLL